MRHFRLWPSHEYEQGQTVAENEAENESQTVPHLAQNQVDSMAKSAAGWLGERCFGNSSTCSGQEKKLLNPRAGWLSALRSGGAQVSWTSERLSEESKLQYPRPGWSRSPRSGGAQVSWTAEGSSGELTVQCPRPDWSRAPRSGDAQLSWTAELAQPSERARKVSRTRSVFLGPLRLRPEARVETLALLGLMYKVNDPHRLALGGGVLRGLGYQWLGHCEGKQTLPHVDSLSCSVRIKLTPGKQTAKKG